MYLITKNKIADYIQQHPEAQAAFLTWIKEFPYYQGKNLFKGPNNQPIEYTVNGWFGVGGGDYSIEFKLNPWLKTGYLVWLGTKEALVEHQDREFEKLKAKCAGLQRKVFSTPISIEVPDFDGSTANAEDNEISDLSETGETVSVSVGVPVDLTPVHLGNAPEIFPSKIENHVASEQDLKTKTEYENALDKAIVLFESAPGTPEFEELALLLHRIRHYEASHIELPQLAIRDAVKLQMKTLDLPSSFLIQTIGSQEEVDLFLSGKNSLPEKSLQAVCDLLFLRIPLNDKSLIK